MKLIKRGAEANLFLTELNGLKCIVKKRIKKKYRNKELDEMIRFQRTKREGNLIKKARNIGVKTPFVFEIENECLYLELIKGNKVKDIINKRNSKQICDKITKNIVKLHKNNLIHGDITTSNMIKEKKEIMFIDFGLAKISSSEEDKAVDLLAFKRNFKASHPEINWNKIEKNYCKEMGEKIVKRMKLVEKRARYL